MKHSTRIVIKPLIFGALFGLVAPLPFNAYAGDNPALETTPAAKAAPNYSGLADLITMICDDALVRFQGFYGPGVVKVEPFSTIGFYEKNKHSELGMTLADQMTSVINNDTLANGRIASGMTTQKLHGILQEVDGYLRIHISGVNTDGERTSYVVSVEMSEPIYRALHTYL